MGTDVERGATNLQAIHEAWAAILDVGVAIWLLERQLGVACLVPVIICIGIADALLLDLRMLISSQYAY
jgi:ATP-binding cassette subfamily C (CFTR/MRP) protein 1